MTHPSRKSRAPEQTGRMEIVTRVSRCVFLVAVGSMPWICSAAEVVGWGSNGSGERDLPTAATNTVAIAAGLNDSLLLYADASVAALGASYSGPPMPTDLTNVVAISGAAAHSLVLRDNGTVSAWGEGFPKAFVPAGVSNVVAVATGFEHSLVLRSDGTVFGWGGYWGSTGDGPHVVPPGLSNVVAIAAGGGKSLALLQDRTVTTWGGFYVPSNLTDVVAIAVGGYHALALKSDGSVAAWGDNLTGQLDVPADLTNTIAISAGWYHSLALTADGRIVPWGYNHGGQLDVPAGLTNVAAIAAGYTHGLALLSQEPPRIVQSPLDHTAIAGDSALFAGNASGALPTSYQWKFHGTNVGGNIGGSLLLTNVEPWQAGGYSFVATNRFGKAESATGVLSVLAFVLTPPANQTVYVGEDVAVSISLQGKGPFTFQWGRNGTNLVDQTNAVLLLPAIGTNQAGNYSVAVTNDYGGMESAEAVLTVLDTAPFFVVPPASLVTWFGANAGFQPVVKGSRPMDFQWAFNGSPLPDGTNATLLFSPLETHHGGVYRLFVSNALDSFTTAPLTMTVVPVAAWGTTSVTNLPASLTNAIAVAAGPSHALALKPNGTVVSWGASTTVPSYVTNVAAIAAAQNQSLALRSNGTVAAWNTILTAPAAATNVSAIAAGGFSGSLACFALRSNGTLVAWSSAATGITNAPAGLNTIAAIAAGRYHALALRPDGLISQWADAADGGKNNVPANLADVVAVAACAQHSLALRSNGTVVAWGLNSYGQTNVPTGLSNVVAISAGEENSQALRGDGSLVIWGRNNYGQTNLPAGISNVVQVRGGMDYNLALLGRSDLNIVRQPASINGIAGLPALLSVGVVSRVPFTYQWQRDGTNIPSATNAVYRVASLKRSHEGIHRVLLTAGSIVVTSAPAQVVIAGNQAIAWGVNTAGQTNVPAGMASLAVEGGVNYSLALLADGTVASWGGPSAGTAPTGATNLVAIAAGNRHNLALRADGKVVAWGETTYGATLVPASLTGVKAIAAGDTFSLALKSDGFIEQWGSLASAPAGLSNTVSLSAGYTHALAARSDGAVLTWGSAAPAVPTGLTNAISVAGGGNFSLALKADGTVQAWGTNTYGQLNVPPGLTNVVAVSAGAYAGLALKADGTLSTWGRNLSGLTNPPPGLSNIIAITGGEAHSLALAGVADPAIVRQMPPTNRAAVFQRVFLSVGAISSAPLKYQWLRNGTNVAGATNAVFYLASAQTNDAGLYSVLVSNTLGFAVSADTLLQIIAHPPSILTQPAGQTNIGGAAAAFQVIASGTAPLTYQWRKNTQPLPGEAASTLAVSNLRRTNEGVYTVIVSNQFGWITSSNAPLRVLVPQRLQPPLPSLEGGIDLLFGDGDGEPMTPSAAGQLSVQASTNLVSWETLTNSLLLTNGAFLLQDLNYSNWPQRYYRVLEGP